MTNHIKPIAIAAVFLVGCAVGGASSQFVVPQASAQQQATMTKWEYNCFAEWSGITERSNQLGAEGWEMVAAAGAGAGSGVTMSRKMVWCFKRPRP